MRCPAAAGKGRGAVSRMHGDCGIAGRARPLRRQRRSVGDATGVVWVDRQVRNVHQAMVLKALLTYYNILSEDSTVYFS